MRRVVVTGIGLISPLGLSTKESWKNCVEGKSGAAQVTKMNMDAYATKIAAEVKGFDGEKYFDAKELNRYDIAVQYAFGAAFDALKDSGVQITPQNAERIGIIIGSGIGGLKNIYDTSVLVATEGPRRVSPFFVPGSIINTCSGYAAIRFGAKGPNYGVVSACATGNHAISDGFHSIRRDEADVMIVGSSEAAINPLGFAGFAAARALSKRNDQPEKASRPFDRDRDGFVMGEGAAVLVIEAYEHAKGRGAPIYAEICGCGMGADAYHITAPAENGEGAARTMKLALDWSGVRAEEIDYINAHGTSTIIGDIAETQAIRSVFGPHADTLAVSSTKSMTGHLLGSASSLEAAFTILAIRDGILPPTINLDNQDPQCDLDYVPNVARPREIRVALSNGFGFGGTNTSLCVKKVE